MRTIIAFIICSCCTVIVLHAAPNPKATGYRGLWYACTPMPEPYLHKYSGGLGTYCAKHRPLAVYAPAMNKTFFCYGGTTTQSDCQLQSMVSYYDHATGHVPRPTIVVDRSGTNNAHCNPVITLDDSGYVWIFSTQHGGDTASTGGYIHRSTEPYSVEEFTLIGRDALAYAQPWNVPGHGFAFFVTHYLSLSGTHRQIYFRHGVPESGGLTWEPERELARIEYDGNISGHYQVSQANGTKAGTAFNMHPLGAADRRTNLYYIETPDIGSTWTTAAGETLSIPVTAVDGPALVHDYMSEDLLVYMKDLRYDTRNRPQILFLTAPDCEPGPQNDPRTLKLAKWTGTQWDIIDITTTDHNYDMGELYLEPDGTWRIIAPTTNGPQAYGGGGEVTMWTSADEGRTWTEEKQCTFNSRYNHSYIRQPVHADSLFYAFWADGHSLYPSRSSLYFCDKAGNVRQLPYEMDADTAVPEIFTGIDITDLAVASDTVELLLNDCIQLQAGVVYADGDRVPVDSGITWSVVSSGIVSVDRAGIVTGLALGTADVVCTHDTLGFADTCRITVVELSPGVLFDDFEDGGRLTWTPSTASRWSIDEDQGDHALHLNTSDFQPDGVNPEEYDILEAGPFTDFELEVLARTPEPGTNAAPDGIIVFGYVDDDNFHYFIPNGRPGATAVYGITGGVRTELYNFNESMITDEYHRYRIIVSGDSISIYFENELKVTVGSAVPEGKVGLGAFNDEVYFDNFKLTAPGMTGIRQSDTGTPRVPGMYYRSYTVTGYRCPGQNHKPGIYLVPGNDGTIKKKLILE